MGIEDDNEGNFAAFRDCLFEAIAAKLAPTGKPVRKSSRANGISTSKKNSKSDTDATANENNPAELAEFSDFIAGEIFPSLPSELQSLSHRALKEDQDLADKWSIPLSLSVFEELSGQIDPSVADSLTAYGLVEPPKSDLQSFISPVITGYISAVVVPPPAWISTKVSACEICDRDWVPLTYHHLIPREVHAKVLKRGWHEEHMLNSVAWLCRACHSFVHKMASNEELAKEWHTVEKICSREDIQKWAQWVGRDYDHPHEDCYKPRDRLECPLSPDQETREHIQQLIVQADDLDRFCHRIEDLVTISIVIDSNKNRKIKTQLRSYNRREEQANFVARCPNSSLSLGLVSDQFYYCASKKWFVKFENLVKMRIQREMDGAVEQRDHYASTCQVGMNKPRINNPANKKPTAGAPASRSPRRMIRSDHASVSEKIAIDPVIEQWYTDPYNRYDPEGLAGKALRRQVLTTALRNRGFRGGRVNKLVNWLLRCNGRYRAYEERVGSKKRKFGTLTKAQCSQTPPSRDRPVQTIPKRLRFESAGTEGAEKISKDDKDLRKERVPSAFPTVCSPSMSAHNRFGNTAVELETIDNDTDIFTDFSATDGLDEDEDDDGDSGFYPFASEIERESVMRQLKEEITGVRSAFQSSHAPGTQAFKEEYEDWCLEDLQRTQSFWNIIYGDDLDGPSDSNDDKNKGKEDIKFTYFREAAGFPSLDIQYPSQGNKPLKCIMLNGKEVWTEDETFGLYVPPKHERLN